MVSQSFLCALGICAFLNSAVASVDTGTCDANDPEKCTSSAGMPQPTKGNALLQAVHTKARVKDVHEEAADSQEEEREVTSQLEENFAECEKHAQMLTDRLRLTVEAHESGEDVLDAEHEQKVRSALVVLQKAEEEIKKMRSVHASFIQSSTSDGKEADKSKSELLKKMGDVRKLAKEAEEVLSEVHSEEEDGEEGDEEQDEALLQEGDEEEDEEEEDEREEESEDEDSEDEEEEEDEAEDDEEIPEDAMKGEGVFPDEDDHKDVSDVSEMQEEKTIERH